MEKSIHKLELVKYKSNNSTIFTGRPQGADVRQALRLDELDKNSNQIVLVIPDGTTSFNPSFYLGLLFKSFENLGIDNFDKKYSFEIITKDEPTRKVLLSNLDDGKRYAINFLSSGSSFKDIFKKRK